MKAFKYLGSVVTSDNNVNTEIKSRLVAGNKVYFTLQNLLKNKNILRKVKLNIYKTLIRPVVLYGRETWALTKKDALPGKGRF